MQSLPPLVTFLLLMVSGWVSRHQQQSIEYLQTENRLLREKLQGRRIRFTDAERALLARKYIRRILPSISMVITFYLLPTN